MLRHPFWQAVGILALAYGYFVWRAYRRVQAQSKLSAGKSNIEA
jgi:hypothetical protein